MTRAPLIESAGATLSCSGQEVGKWLQDAEKRGVFGEEAPKTGKKSEFA